MYFKSSKYTSTSSYREVGLMKKKPKSESLDNFKNNWNERIEEFQKTCDFEYQILDVKGFLLK